MPTSLKAPTFSAATNEAAIDTLELQAKGITVVQQLLVPTSSSSKVTL